MMTHPQPRERLRGERGVTLIELLVVVMILGIVGGIVGTSIVQALRATDRAQDRIAALADLQKGIERFGRELRVADPLRVSTAGNFATEIGALVYRTGEKRTYKYRIEVNAGTGEQELWQDLKVFAITADIDVDPPLRAPTSRFIARIANDQLAEPLVRYFDGDGAEITCTPGVLGKTLPDCIAEYSAANQIKLTLSKILDNRDPLRVETVINLRNTRYKPGP